MKHTPTPWKSEPTGIRDASDKHIPWDEDTKQIIVQAVNAHDKLVNAAIAAKLLLLQTVRDEYIDVAIDLIDAALALALAKGEK